MGDDSRRDGPTRREYVKYGGAVLTGGLLAGCTGNTDAGAQETTEATTTAKTAMTATTEAEETTTESEQTTAEDISYDVEVKPYGDVLFDAVPESYVTLGSGAWADIAFAFGSEPDAMSKRYYPLQYYEALPGVSFDSSGVTDLGDVSEVDAELFFELDADVHLIDKQLLASYAGWDADDFEQVESNVGPFAGSYLRGEWSGKALGVEFSFPYYTLPEAISLVGEVFQAQSRATTWNDQLDSFAADIDSTSPDSSPNVGVIYSGSNPAEGTFYIKSPTAAGVGNYPYELLGVSNAFAEFTGDGTYQIDYEGLLQADPDYIFVDSAISGLSTQEFESQIVEPMRDHPVGSELTAVQNDTIVRGCGRHQGPIIAHFETEAMAKQLYPDAFGTFDAEAFPSVPEAEQLFDRQRLADIVNGDR
ncbi:ABC transporter substrate-binding protein [Haloferax namakaokahaiae]|uniref:ABC transporter substrate-binding protein n=1 Tax=Haloferax namakaokahaiae TaxID=1748331 RepID=A0ABD5ZEH7_9EURY